MKQNNHKKQVLKRLSMIKAALIIWGYLKNDLGIKSMRKNL